MCVARYAAALRIRLAVVASKSRSVPSKDLLTHRDQPADLERHGRPAHHIRQRSGLDACRDGAGRVAKAHVDQQQQPIAKGTIAALDPLSTGQPSGKVLPNPAEVLLHDRLGVLHQHLPCLQSNALEKISLTDDTHAMPVDSALPEPSSAAAAATIVDVLFSFLLLYPLQLPQ